MLPRIFFDGNEGNDEIGYPLCFPTSEEDINIKNQIHEGMRVIIYSPDEMEMEAVFRYDPEYQCWVAMPIERTLKLMY